MKRCEVRNCEKVVKKIVNVVECLDDGAWNIQICKKCAKKLNIKEGDHLPSNAAKILGLL